MQYTPYMHIVSIRRRQTQASYVDNDNSDYRKFSTMLLDKKRQVRKVMFYWTEDLPFKNKHENVTSNFLLQYSLHNSGWPTAPRHLQEVLHLIRVTGAIKSPAMQHLPSVSHWTTVSATCTCSPEKLPEIDKASEMPRGGALEVTSVYFKSTRSCNKTFTKRHVSLPNRWKQIQT